MSILTPEQVTETVQRFIDQTDWQNYHQKVSWHLQVPSCPFYEGSMVCPVWQSWIREGRDLFPKGEDGKRKLMSDVVEHAVRPGYQHYPQTPEELEKRCSILAIS